MVRGNLVSGIESAVWLCFGVPGRTYYTLFLAERAGSFPWVILFTRHTCLIYKGEGFLLVFF